MSNGGSPSAVVMVRPHHFRVNPDTAADNAFQHGTSPDPQAAYSEVTGLADTLSRHGVTVHLFEDDGTSTPDSVFPNNWFSTHEDGRVALYPMRAENRRSERRQDILGHLRAHFRVSETVDYSTFEDQGKFLEGTGSLVLDRKRRVAFAAISTRTSTELVDKFCDDFGYRAVAFTATDASGAPVYHTNVILTLGSGYAIAALDMIDDEQERRAVRDAIGERKLISISEAQVSDFAGNAFELSGTSGPILAMSKRAASALLDDQRSTIEHHAEILAVAVPTIEAAGGSVRCMMAGIHLPNR